MPRKVIYKDDDDDYGDDDDYEDYDYDYDSDSDSPNHDQMPNASQEAPHQGVWRCPICTYDNDDDMTACDICSVLRYPLVDRDTDSHKNRADQYQGYGVSKLARSLFESMPLDHETSKTTFSLQQKIADSLTREHRALIDPGNLQGDHHELHEAFGSRGHKNIKIAAFKFDVPSPDDIVSAGLNSSRAGRKASVVMKKPSSNVTAADNSSVVMPRSRDGKFDEGSNKNNEGGLQPGFGINSSTSTKSTHDSLDNDGSSKFNAAHTELNDEKFDTSSSRMDGVVEGSSSMDGINTENLPHGISSITLNSKDGRSDKHNAQDDKLQREYKIEKWMLPENTDGALAQLNLAIVGHVDSGKSTLSGRLLHLLGRISPKEMHKYEKEAKLQGKGSFAYAWALDESPEERERGITMTVAVAYFDTKKYHVVLLDSPGHKDFVPNMISGATQADAAVLVVDASVGSFEAGIDRTKGQTREHAQLIRSFGVDQLIVAINKMDAVGYSRDRFDFIKQQLGPFLRICGFKDSVVWIPLSAMENQNLVDMPSDVRLSWYEGPCLLHAIDSLQQPLRDLAKPLAMPICDVVRSASMGQVSTCGKLEAGAVRSGVKVLVMPSGVVGTVRSLERDSHPCAVARAGDNVAVILQGIDGSHVIPGGVLCHPDFPVSVAKHMELKVLVLDGASPILMGSQVEFHIHHAKEAARVEKICALLDSKTGKEVKRFPRCLVAKQSAIVEVVLYGAVCAQEYSSSKALGRVFLRALGRTIAVGVVTRIMAEQE